MALQKYIQVRVQARVLRTIDKVGGLDEYLLGESPARIKELGMEGWKMRWRLMQDRGVKERLRRRRVELGLPPQGLEMFLSDTELLDEKQGIVDKARKEVEIAPSEMTGEEPDDHGRDIFDEEVERMTQEEKGEMQRRQVH